MSKFSMEFPRHIKRAFELMQAGGFEAYAVGGCVRDVLMDKQPSDYDIATSALPGEIHGCFDGLGYSIIDVGIKHGTVAVVIEGNKIEITSFRKDGEYKDNRHPSSVNFTRSINEDLSRRDFTVNAMAYNDTEGLIDLFGGVDDIKAGLIRCVGCPTVRFNEDGLRILRGLRFAARFGFEIERETAEAIHTNKALLDNISAERIFVELKGILAADFSEAVLRNYRDVFELIVSGNYDARAVASAPKDIAVKLALLGADENSLSRLKCDNKTKRETLDVLKYFNTELNEPDIRRILGYAGSDTAKRVIAAVNSTTGKDYTELMRKARAEGCPTSMRQLRINGNDIMKLGAGAGSETGDVLRRLYSEVVDGILKNEHEVLRGRASEIINGKINK